MCSLFWQGQKDAINRRFLALLDDPNLTILVPVFAPFRYKTVIYTVLLHAQSPLRLRVLYIFTIKRNIHRKWWMSLFMAGAEGLEPSARGFGVNPRSKKPRAFIRTVEPFL